MGSSGNTGLPPALGDEGTPPVSAAVAMGAAGQTEGSEWLMWLRTGVSKAATCILIPRNPRTLHKIFITFLMPHLLILKFSP